jgi:hypothetical protein
MSEIHIYSRDRLLYLEEISAPREQSQNRHELRRQPDPLEKSGWRSLFAAHDSLDAVAIKLRLSALLKGANERQLLPAA